MSDSSDFLNVAAQSNPYTPWISAASTLANAGLRSNAGPSRADQNATEIFDSSGWVVTQSGKQLPYTGYPGEPVLASTLQAWAVPALAVLAAVLIFRKS